MIFAMFVWTKGWASNRAWLLNLELFTLNHALSFHLQPLCSRPLKSIHLSRFTRKRSRPIINTRCPTKKCLG
ncbi:hypothetical protein BDP27DRAFT_1327937 [Rhodocollybia butyracea]|uniref:Secreted protein n=1 Tax=Rhodocollybia butyracea TaxID=206335 RepID=A0A9P5U6L0_9AGAR|nr:hypothetical protein BDP27DRAFT_1327937 [Rhodocollybia butyracea]